MQGVIHSGSLSLHVAVLFEMTVLVNSLAISFDRKVVVVYTEERDSLKSDLAQNYQ